MTDTPLAEGDRVALKRDPSYTGAVKGPVLSGSAYVEFDQGGGGNFDVRSLVAEGKSWPPAMETK